MRTLSIFNNVSLDGYFADAAGDMSWAHKNDPEWTAFTSGNAQGGGALLFGRQTYEMMAGFWPTPMAAEMMPVVAESMNAMEKYVFSRTLKQAAWQNTTVLRGNIAAETRRLKESTGPDIVIMGSGTIVAQLTEAGLIDVYQIAVAPIVLGAGRGLFEGVTRRPVLKRTSSRTFENGNVFLTYEKEE
ncbi:MAG TPA: dihydrofolate reductase family protein [Rhizomicrobium sp.]|nr:dihydrofolate reductase family protein [Rhizomicrobium sp.]